MINHKIYYIDYKQKKLDLEMDYQSTLYFYLELFFRLAKDLFFKLIAFDPINRYTALEALKHP